MALTYPLSLASFMQLYRIAMISLQLNVQQEMSQQASGGNISRDLGPQFWTADISTGNLNDNDVEDMLSLLRALEQTQGTFLCTNSRRRYPKADPTGSIVGTSTVQINSNTSVGLSLKGLPAAYVLNLGDYISVVYGSPSERILFQLEEGITANGSGVTGTFAVHPAVPPAMAANAACTLKQPTVQMTVVPGSIKQGDAMMWSTISFQARESTGT